jgi:ribokinase
MRFMVIGAAALDRPVWLSGPMRAGARVQGRSLGEGLQGRLGGGGANAGVALAKAGHEVLLAASPSAEPDGAEILDLCRAAGLNVRFSALRPGRGGQTLIFIEPDGERIVMGLDKHDGPLPAIAAPPADLPVIDGLFVRATYPGAAAWAAAATGPVLLHQPATDYAGPADVIVASSDDLDDAALLDPFGHGRRRLHPDQRERLQWVVVTHGARGAVAHGASECVEAPAAAAACVRDTTGAGDVFAAGLLEALAAGAPMRNALRQACAWGAVAVGQEGSAPVDAPPEAFAALRRETA